MPHPEAFECAPQALGGRRASDGQREVFFLNVSVMSTSIINLSLGNMSYLILGVA